MSHRYWYFVNQPEIGVHSKQGWCFGADALAAALDAIEVIRERDHVKGAAFLLANDVHVTHCGACSCIPAEDRTW